VFSNSSAQENADFAKVERREVFVGGGFAAAHKNPLSPQTRQCFEEWAFSNASSAQKSAGSVKGACVSNQMIMLPRRSRHSNDNVTGEHFED